MRISVQTNYRVRNSKIEVTSFRNLKKTDPKTGANDDNDDAYCYCFDHQKFLQNYDDEQDDSIDDAYDDDDDANDHCDYYQKRVL